MLAFKCSNHNVQRESRVQSLCHAILNAKLVKGESGRNSCPFCKSDVVFTNDKNEEKKEAESMIKINHNGNCPSFVARDLRTGWKIGN